MKKYNMVDKRCRDSREELKEYTLEELKEYFKPDDPDYSEYEEELEKWKKIRDIDDLVSFLEWQANGMAQPYTFSEANHL